MSQAVESLSSCIQAVEQAASPQSLIAAVTTLVARQSPDAIPTLLAVLGYNNPGAAVVAMSGLVTLGYVAVPFLLRGLDDYNYGARSYAIRALAAIGHPDALPVLQHAQKLGLHARRDLRNFVEEDGAVVGQFEASLALLQRAGECALLVTEQLAFHQGLGQGSAVNRDKRLLAARAQCVQLARNQLLAGSALAEDQHGRVAFCGLSGVLDRL